MGIRSKTLVSYSPEQDKEERPSEKSDSSVWLQSMQTDVDV